MNSEKIIRMTVASFDEFRMSPSAKTLRDLVECSVLWSRHSVIAQALHPIIERVPVETEQNRSEVSAAYERISRTEFDLLVKSLEKEIEAFRSLMRAN